MPELTGPASHELGFWRGLVEQHGAGYRAFRIAEYKDKTQRFEPWWSEQEGNGVEIGCGCLSVFDEDPRFRIFIDPLIYEYCGFCFDIERQGRYWTHDAEDMSIWRDETFEFAVCINMLDHTPNPGKVVSEIYRLLKPGGRLFMEVHLDDALSPAHYGLWTEQTVKDIVDPVFQNCLMKQVVRVDQDNQSQYWAVFQK